MYARRALGWHTLDDGLAGGEQVAKLFFGALASAGENQHLEIEEFARREIVAGLNHVVHYQQLAAWIHGFSADFPELDAQLIRRVMNDVRMCV